MTISLYDVSVASFLRTLGAVSGFLDKGLAHCEANGIDPATLVETQLKDDMLPFMFQVVSVAHHTRGAIAGAKAGVFSPSSGIGTLDYAGLQKLVADARSALQAMTPDEINALEGRDMVFQLGERQMPFTVPAFLMSFSIPNQLRPAEFLFPPVDGLRHPAPSGRAAGQAGLSGRAAHEGVEGGPGVHPEKRDHHPWRNAGHGPGRSQPGPAAR